MEILPFNERPCPSCGKPYRQGNDTYWGYCPECGNLEQFYEMLPAQKAFHSSSTKYRLYAGGFGSGKTTCGVMEAMQLALRYPKNFILVGAQTYTNLRDTTLSSFLDWVPDPVLKGGSKDKAFNKAENTLYFRNGSIVIFRSMDEPNKYKSLNLGAFYIDELTEIGEEVWNMLESRLRRTNLPRRTGFATTNPEGGSWVYEKFVQNNENKANYDYFQAPTTENLHLPSDYVQGLLDSYSEDWVRRYIYADWTAFEGQIYTEFTPTFPYVIPHQEPKKTWPIFVGIDHGIHNPTAAVWGSINPRNGDIYIFQEYYKKNQLVEHHANQIKFLSKDYAIYAYFIDPSTQNRNAVTGQSVRGEYIQHGLPVRLANNDLLAGIHRVSAQLKKHPDGTPKLVISERCENLIEELTQYRWEKNKNPDKNDPEKPHPYKDHSCFIAGTQIETIDGLKPIETVDVGDRVLTREGYRPVIDQAMTDSMAETFTVNLSNGKTLTGTGNHPIWVRGEGWKDLSELQEGDLLLNPKALSTKESHSDATQSQKDVQTAFTSRPEEIIAKKALDGSTRKSGEITSGKSLKATTFTIKTKIHSITNWITSNVCPEKNTYHNMLPSQNELNSQKKTSKKFVLSQLNGTNPKLGESGIASTEKRHGRIVKQLQKLAKTAIKSTKQLLDMGTKGFVPITVSPHGVKNQALTTNGEFVQSAGLSSQSISTQKRKPVPENVRVVSLSKDEQKQPVYNLTVDEVHEYFANGVLVSNCDALRYFIMGLPKNFGNKPVATEYRPRPIKEFNSEGDYEDNEVFSGLV